jgi:hypothetical protein
MCNKGKYYINIYLIDYNIKLKKLIIFYNNIYIMII